MAKLEEIILGSAVKGILVGSPVTVVQIDWYGAYGGDVVTVTYKEPSGRTAQRMLFRDVESQLEVVPPELAWTFDGDGALLRLVSEALRIQMAHLFDPVLAVHSSLVEALPHQISAVYEEMLTRQPLRFLLADDPGAGKTIMAGLLIKELLARGDLRRCLICCPGSLVDQWQDELERKFHVGFTILGRESFEQARTGNPFLENDLVIARLDQMSRSDEVREKLKATDWDLVICDEAHKMSAAFYGGNEVKKTKRYELGELLGGITRNFLLMTATPHNGKEEDFQLFMALLDEDRFEGRPRGGAEPVDTSDMMRRLVKEELLRFDKTRLFPPRLAYTVNYSLSPGEKDLYEQVTDYVRQEMNRADRLAREGQGRRGNTVGFAVTVLQRRLASSPEAIYRSLRRRRERLQARLAEEQRLRREAEAPLATDPDVRYLDADEQDDLDDAPHEEVELVEELVLDRATAAQTVAELEAEILTLSRLESLALRVRNSRTDRKWEELSRILQEEAEMFDDQRQRRKLVIFTEHRDTLNYLRERIGDTLIGPEAIVVIHGGLGREERLRAQHAFTQDKDVQVLLATDAAGEGINLQRAHLMVNYDLPWNPNRIEQRFGRIHRIGQKEICHLWNLVANETREGDVFFRLLEKLENARGALDGRVFDVLGSLFQETSLRDLLIEAIRHGNDPEVRARLHEQVDSETDFDRLRELLAQNALSGDVMDAAQVQKIREDMERAAARRLQPHFIASFFLEAFERLGGTIRRREEGRYEITHVPQRVRQYQCVAGRGQAILQKYERVTFLNDRVSVEGRPDAEFLTPGHPLLETVITILMDQHKALLKTGAVLIDPGDLSDTVRALFYLDHVIQDGRRDRQGNHRIVSRQMQFFEMDPALEPRMAGYAPYLDYRPATDEERALLGSTPVPDWLPSNPEATVVGAAARTLVPQHVAEVRRRTEERILKTMAAVRARLTQEINHWDARANELQAQEAAGRQPKINPSRARQRADDLQGRLDRRMLELEQERQLMPLPPNVVGGALIAPQGLIDRLLNAGRVGDTMPPTYSLDPAARARIERLAMDAVMAQERQLGRHPRDVSADKVGYDIESLDPVTGGLFFLEVKGRVHTEDSVTVTKNEILTALNKPDAFRLAVVRVFPDGAAPPVYITRPFNQEPAFAATSVTFDLGALLALGGPAV